MNMNHFASFFSDGFITATVVNPPERKLAKCPLVCQSRKEVLIGQTFAKLSTPF
jgi:hypothetical protein